MTVKKEKTVCFTGHRPEKIPGYDSWNNSVYSVIKSMLYYQIYQSVVDEGYEYFITGLARGIDLLAAKYVIELKKKFTGINLICVKPFEEHGDKFKGQDLWELKNVLAEADDIICVSETYSKGCYKRRNCFMVDNSSKLIAVVDNYKSGTGQTISYANKKGLDVHIINIRDYVSIAPNTIHQKSGFFYLE